MGADIVQFAQRSDPSIPALRDEVYVAIATVMELVGTNRYPTKATAGGLRRVIAVLRSCNAQMILGGGKG